MNSPGRLDRWIRVLTGQLIRLWNFGLFLCICFVVVVVVVVVMINLFY